MQVFKFGGASVKDADAVKNVAEILKRFAGQETIVVVSAMGKVTNGLEELVNELFHKKLSIPMIMPKKIVFTSVFIAGTKGKVTDTFGERGSQVSKTFVASFGTAQIATI